MLQASDSELQTPSAPWSLAAEEAVRQLGSDAHAGLSSDDVARRLQQFGPNRLRDAKSRSPVLLFVRQFADVMIGLLAAAAVVSVVIGEWTDAGLIGLIVVANAVIGFLQEWRAEKAVAALKQLSQPTARVRRAGHVEECSAVDVVPGDVIELTGGHYVPADARLLDTVDLQVNESALTGESLPVEKSPEAVSPETQVPDRTGMVHAGTIVVQGRGRGVVTATGMSSELGRIATMLGEAEEVLTPLQRRLAVLSRRLAVIVVVIAIAVFVGELFQRDVAAWDEHFLGEMLLVAVSLAVAAIPEGLPAVITVVLSLGSRAMARRNAIVRRLSAVETLGSVDVICSDKTGTLTQNRMQVQDIVTESETDAAARMLLEAGVLCNDADVSASGEARGTATEAAILQAALDRGIDVDTLRDGRRRLDELAFNSSRKRMSTLHRAGERGRMLFVKGAAEAVISRCSHVRMPHEESRRAAEKPAAQASDSLACTAGSGASRELTDAERQTWRDRADELATRGRRVLAVAMRSWDDDTLPPEDDADAAESSLELLGLVGIVDPVRPEARESVAHCRDAGIRSVMITGDHAGTARAIAEDLDILRQADDVVTGAELDDLDEDALCERVPKIAVYARVSPHHKLQIVRAWQAHESVVAMTGDGVNDAPALKQADIGVAMGKGGTDVAREASEMVLADDDFATIVAAVEEGRVVYDNIRKFVRYLLAANAGEVLVLVLAMVVGLPLPLLPVHILWINLVTDGLPALALGFEPAERNVMRRAPRKQSESILAGMAGGIVGIGLLMAVCCLVTYALDLHGIFGNASAPAEMGDAESSRLAHGRTMVFTILACLQLFYVLALRSTEQTFFELGPLSNWRLTGAVLIGLAMQLATLYVPHVSRYFHTVPLPPTDLAVALGISTAAFIATETRKLGRRGAGPA